jgi:hypothetical protein
LNPASAVATYLLCRHYSKREWGDVICTHLAAKKAKKIDAPIFVCPVDPDKCAVM